MNDPGPAFVMRVLNAVPHSLSFKIVVDVIHASLGILNNSSSLAISLDANAPWPPHGDGKMTTDGLMNDVGNVVSSHLSRLEYSSVDVVLAVGADAGDDSANSIVDAAHPKKATMTLLL